ncbi:MAG TPA: flagellar basal body P-ring formation chaperone FlgA [Pseudomonadales bacterium]|nr:flagellar basal body P-ring formation chaperone FlgA [Pseudomonadales bacterium]
MTSVMRIGHISSPNRSALYAFLCIFINGVFTSTLFASESRQQITDAVTQAVSDQIDGLFPEKKLRREILVSSLDDRLQLASCEKLHVTLPVNQSYNRRINAKVDCLDSASWSITVAVSIQVFKPVAVASNQLLRNHRIRAEDIGFAEVELGSLKQGYFSSSQELIGLQLKRNLMAQAPFTPKLLMAPVLIQRGEQVVISAQSAALLVKTNGIALSNGALGQKIQIKNLRSERVIEGKVTGPGQVMVNM